MIVSFAMIYYPHHIQSLQPSLVCNRTKHLVDKRGEEGAPWDKQVMQKTKKFKRTCLQIEKFTSNFAFWKRQFFSGAL